MPMRSRQRRWLPHSAAALLGLIGAYLLLAYVVTPRLWRHYEHHPALAGAPKTATTADGIPGDALNVGFAGTQAELIRALVAAGWVPADPLTIRSSIGIVDSVLLGKPDPSAPVSTLLLWGRPQDLAFEREVGRSAKQRHHVRLWAAPDEFGLQGRPLWLGAATFDTGVGLSHDTGQVTHHIAPAIDAERDGLVHALEQAGQVSALFQVTGVGATLQGRNGGGDWYYTDGELDIAVLSANNAVQSALPARAASPPAVTIKNRIWSWLRRLLPR